jgi:hypothetical protein
MIQFPGSGWQSMDVFRKYFGGAKGAFVIKSHRPPLPPRPHQYFLVRNADYLFAVA